MSKIVENKVDNGKGFCHIDCVTVNNPSMKTYIKTPELEKVQSAKAESQAIGGFLEWLQCEKGWELAYRHKHTMGCYSHGKVNPPTNVKDRVYSSDEWRRKYTDEKWISCGCEELQFLPAIYSPEKLMAEYFKIDLDKVDHERRAILDSLHPD